MAWLFERTIELAAWISLVLAFICLGDSIYLLVQWTRAWMDGETAPQVMFQAGQAMGGFVLFALAMGALACIDRYVFDTPEATSK